MSDYNYNYENDEYQYERLERLGKIGAIMPKIVGVASIIGSSIVIYTILCQTKERSSQLQQQRGRRRRRQSQQRRSNLHSIFNRLLLALSICDILSSFGFALSTWPMPSEQPSGMQDVIPLQSHFDYHKAIPYAVGNRNTCQLQGILIMIGLTGSVFFNGFIALQGVLIVRYRWTEASMKIAERIFFVLALSTSILTSTIRAFKRQFNPSLGGVCYINQYPLICWNFWYETYDNVKGQELVGMKNNTANVTITTTDSSSIEDWCLNHPDYVDENATNRLFNILTFSTMAVIFLISIGCTVLLFLSVRQQELRSSRWSLSTSGGLQGRDQDRVLRKALLLTIVYVFFSIGGWATRSPLGRDIQTIYDIQLHSIIATNIFVCQGILNALVMSNYADKILFESRWWKNICCCSCFAPDKNNSNETNNETDSSNQNDTTIYMSAIFNNTNRHDDDDGGGGDSSAIFFDNNTSNNIPTTNKQSNTPPRSTTPLPNYTTNNEVSIVNET